MKQIYILIICLCFCILSANSQWILQPITTSDEHRIVYFINASTGFKVGFNITLNRNVLFRTTNTGTTWDSALFSTTESVYNIFFLNASTGWMVGNITSGFKASLGRIWRTTNTGTSWTAQTLFSDTTSLRSIYFIDANTGYTVGYRLPNGTACLRSINGGITWTNITSIPSDITSARDVFFLNINTGWIVGTKGTPKNRYPSILRTTDAGTTWLNSDLSGYILTYLSFITFFNAQTGYAGGSRDTSLTNQPLPRMFKSTNGGVSWAFQTLPYTTAPNIHFVNGMYFQDVNTGWAVGDRGSICYTSNGGTNWDYQTSSVGTNINLTDVYFSGGNGWTVGSSGTILKTTNGGITFIQPVGNSVPDNFILHQNYPNPFNPSTTIRFDIPKQSFAKLSLFNSLGQETAVIVNDILDAGTYEYKFNADGLASGVYFIKLSAGDFSDVKKITLLK